MHIAQVEHWTNTTKNSPKKKVQLTSKYITIHSQHQNPLSNPTCIVHPMKILEMPLNINIQESSSTLCSLGKLGTSYMSSAQANGQMHHWCTTKQGRKDIQPSVKRGGLSGGTRKPRFIVPLFSTSL